MRESQVEKWNRLYSEQNKVRKIFKEPYAYAVAPFMAGVIDYYNRPLRILVIGGGDGHFTRDLLPEIRNFLRIKKVSARIEVVESDLTEMVSKSPGVKVRADAHALPFTDSSFDLVIGESMIHQPNGREGMGQRIKEIHRVLKEDGSFIHVQDSIPDPGSWAGIPLPAPIFKLNAMQSAILQDSLFAEAHKNLILELRRLTRERHMSFGALGVSGSKLFPETKKLGEIEGLNFDNMPANYFHLKNGVLEPRKDSSIPRNKKRLQYSGMISIASKQPKITSILDFLVEKKYFSNPSS